MRLNELVARSMGPAFKWASSWTMASSLFFVDFWARLSVIGFWAVFADLFGWDSAYDGVVGHVLGDDRIGSHDASVADRHACREHRVVADHAVVADSDGETTTARLCNRDAEVVEWMNMCFDRGSAATITNDPMVTSERSSSMT